MPSIIFVEYLFYSALGQVPGVVPQFAPFLSPLRGFSRRGGQEGSGGAAIVVVEAPSQVVSAKEVLVVVVFVFIDANNRASGSEATH